MKTRFLKIAVLAAFAFMTALNVYKSQTEVLLSDTQLKNVEALASGEQNPDCDNRSGYRQWETKPSSEDDKETAFYDCCYVLRYGYNPNTDCNY